MLDCSDTVACGATPHPPNPLQRGNKGRASARAQGFTLVELLVALAIFAVLMSAVTILFVGSLHTTQVSYQQMKAFELARTALTVINEDLVRGFASIQTADVHSFYGTPIGMTFIGVVKASNEDKDRNLARVTYVIYNKETGEVFPGALEDADAAGNVTATHDAHQYALVRYVEPSVASLDALPFSLDQEMPVEGGPIARTYRNVLDLLCSKALGGKSFDSTRIDLTTEEQDLIRAKTCEMWIRMVAGGDQEFPVNFWKDIKNIDVTNYIVTDAILAIASESERYAEPFVTGQSTSFFDYDYSAAYLNTGAIVNDANAKNRQSLWWNDNRAYNWGDPRLPEIVAVNFWLMFASPYPSAPDFKRHFVLEVDLPTGYQRKAQIG